MFSSPGEYVGLVNIDFDLQIFDSWKSDTVSIKSYLQFL